MTRDVISVLADKLLFVLCHLYCGIAVNHVHGSFCFYTTTVARPAGGPASGLYVDQYTSMTSSRAILLILSPGTDPIHHTRSKGASSVISIPRKGDRVRGSFFLKNTMREVEVLQH